MSVDLLKPGTVPISPDTVLGFEFLLDRDLLHKHLSKNNPDPSPIDLISKFYDTIATTQRLRLEGELGLEGPPAEPNKHPAKNIAMKILSLKTAAYLNWNLEQLKTLPFKTQISLLQDLMYFTSEEKTVLQINNIEEPDTKTASPQFLFALLLFHRWLLSTSMHRVTTNWQQKYGLNEMSPTDETIICCPENIKKTLAFLTDALEWQEIPSLLTFNCFKVPPEEFDCVEFDWHQGKPLTCEEFSAQISFDLGAFFFYQEDYTTANQHFKACLAFQNQLKASPVFAVYDPQVLDMYLKACNSTGEDRHLLAQLQQSIVNQFVGILGILQQDNVQKEIPLVHRINLELDIQGALSSGVFTVARDLLVKVKALNFVRCIVEKQFAVLGSFRNIEGYLWAVQMYWKLYPDEDKQTIKNYLLELIIRNEVPDLTEKLKNLDMLDQIFDKTDQKYLREKKPSVVELPEVLFMTDFGLVESNKKRKPRQEFRQLKRQLINSYDWKEIKELLAKITPSGYSISELNPLWELAIPLQSVVNALPRGLFQDFVYVLLAKSKEQVLNKNWTSALEFLLVLDKELQTAPCSVSKLSKMINWEVLLVQITQLIEEWPKSSVDTTALINACEVCLEPSESSVLPRTEILESCGICLLNLARYDFLIAYESRWKTFEIISAIASNCSEFSKIRQGKKVSKISLNLWEAVLPMLLQTQHLPKRSYSDVANVRNNILAVFSKLKDQESLSVVVSMMTKIYNIVKDEANVELLVECANYWPAMLVNANSYSLTTIAEILSDLLTQALNEHPASASWLRLRGDFNFASGHYKLSLSSYLKALIICTDYFNIPVRFDDHIFRRMIKCCQMLGCFTQAAVLCQFLEESDYALAFRLLGEQKPCNDAMEAYYDCFWDTNILEFLIHNHNKRGEFRKRKTATKAIGMLELNFNNNEEILREASNLRKSVFLRGLCKQYVF